MKKLITFVLFLFASLTLSAQETYIVLLGGQSNMAGRGQFDELSEADKQRVDKAAEMITIVFNGRPEVPLSYQSASKRQSNYGPELFFGVTLHERFPDKKFVFVKESLGGTSLLGAWNPNWTEETAKLSERDEKRQKVKLYEQHTKAITTTLAAHPKAKIIGMLWMQGEKDTRLEVSATTYGENLLKLVNAYRTDFKVKDMPFFFGQVNCPPRGNYLDGVEIVRQQMSASADKSKGLYMIPTSMDESWSDYPKRNDNVHYTTEGQKRLGTAFAEAFCGEVM
ncbi:sialate O-acetylesterase [Flammeovirga sp. MY04]|nr:sialate O-acetylesterase [Flammeovirga sp. MY04]ANQ51594.1 sialate O-acetylesterase [Flammeovirga sp. MY04]